MSRLRRKRRGLDYAKIANLELELYGEAFTVVPKHLEVELYGQALDEHWGATRGAAREHGVPRCINCGDKTMWDHGGWICRSGCTVHRVNEA